jgi:hypothetical protein
MEADVIISYAEHEANGSVSLSASLTFFQSVWILEDYNNNVRQLSKSDAWLQPRRASSDDVEQSI